MKKSFLPIAYHAGEFKNFQDANISIATHALHYGTAAFGGMRAIPNPENPNEILLFRFHEHAKRLSQSAKFLGYDILPENIEKVIIEFLKRNKPQKPIYIRPFVYTSDLDLSPRLHNIEYDFLVYGMEMGDYLSREGISCTISSYVRQMDVSFPLRGKISGAYITSALAKTEAFYRGYDEAILMNSQNKVSEGSAMNIFIVRNGIIYTPGVNQDILEGITRSSVIQIARSLGYDVIERPIDKSELFIADEVFMSGTAARVTPVKKIENFILSENRPIFQKIYQKFENIIEGRNQEFQDWIYKVTI